MPCMGWYITDSVLPFICRYLPELIEDVPHDIIVPITFYTYGMSYQYFIDLVGGSRHSALSIVFGEAEVWYGTIAKALPLLSPET